MKRISTKTTLAFLSGGLAAVVVSAMLGLGSRGDAAAGEDWFEGKHVSVDLADGTKLAGSSISSRAALDRRWWYIQKPGEPPQHFVVNPDQITRIRLTP